MNGQLRLAKAWWKSRTVWLNALVLLLTTAEMRLDLLREVLPVNYFALVAIGLPALNLLLRAKTTLPVAGKDKETWR